jgi:hypothetical protein
MGFPGKTNEEGTIGGPTSCTAFFATILLGSSGKAAFIIPLLMEASDDPSKASADIVVNSLAVTK